MFRSARAARGGAGPCGTRGARSRARAGRARSVKVVFVGPEPHVRRHSRRVYIRFGIKTNENIERPGISESAICVYIYAECDSLEFNDFPGIAFRVYTLRAKRLIGNQGS